VFLLNSRLAHFTAALRREHPLSLSYRVNLPSSLTTAHSSTLVFSTHLPVSVYGTDHMYNSHEDFLASLLSHHSVRRISPYCRFSAQRADLPTHLNTYDLQRTSNRARVVHFWVPPWHRTHTYEQQNINCLSIAYAFRPRLRIRLTLRR
jgi:hypothetical protein